MDAVRFEELRRIIDLIDLERDVIRQAACQAARVEGVRPPPLPMRISYHNPLCG